ncbi:hypothetical protein HHI36_023430 [Cryptolaemus montrouzieri]|uniref:Uncharacterized protein n=1 Tax=Cryptolaemus montrouzieri TaxID=559131 RepID=A0ABD2PHA8_9CUCU
MNSEIDDNNTARPIGSVKKVIVPPKTKSGKSNYILKKIKLKVRQKSISNTGDVSDIPSTSSVDYLTGRQTPEGDENLMFSKSASETNLSENQGASENTESQEVDSEKKSVEGIHAALERTKSLEAFKRMPAYGELIADSPSMTINGLDILDPQILILKEKFQLRLIFGAEEYTLTQ